MIMMRTRTLDKDRDKDDKRTCMQDEDLLFENQLVLIYYNVHRTPSAQLKAVEIKWLQKSCATFRSNGKPEYLILCSKLQYIKAVSKLPIQFRIYKFQNQLVQNYGHAIINEGDSTTNQFTNKNKFL